MLIHLASTNVQFTSEAKEAVSDNEEVFEEIRPAMLEVEEVEGPSEEEFSEEKQEKNLSHQHNSARNLEEILRNPI